MTDTMKLPYHEDAEQAVLGAAVLDVEALRTAAELLRPEDFYREGHRRLWAALLQLERDGALPERGSVDVLAVADALARAGELAAAGGKQYLGFLVDAVPTAANVSFHAALVREVAQCRALVQVGGTVATLARERQATARDIAQRAVADLLAIAAPQGGASGFVSAREVAGRFMAALDDRIQAARQGRTVGVPTGYPEIDDVIGGFLPGDLVTIAGVPGSGKTALAENIALYNVVRASAQGRPLVPTAIVSAEMTAVELFGRMACNLVGIDTRSLRTGRLDDADIPRLVRATGELSAAPLYIDETPCPSLPEVEARCRAQKARHPELGLLVVDYLQLIEDQSEDTRAESIRFISNRLKGLGKSLGVPVLVLAQPNSKEIAKRSDPHPLITDLQGSNGPEQASDFVFLLCRPKQYGKSVVDVVDVDCAKGRGTGPFQVQLEAEMQFVRITSRVAASPAAPRRTTDHDWREASAGEAFDV